MADNLKAFMVKNRAVKTNTKYAASEEFIGEDGKPIEWELKPLSPKKNDELIDVAMEVSIDKDGKAITRFSEAIYRERLIIESVISPNLDNAQLQDFYNVKEPGDLVNAMLNIKEYKALSDKIQEVNGFKKSMKKEVEEVKNS